LNNPSRALSIKERKAASRKQERGKDLELVRRAQQGDELAFGLLVENYQRKVYTIALGMVKNPEDAMDIAQDAFVKIHKYLKNFQDSSSFYTWLYRIVVNLCIDHLRKSGKRTKLEFDDKLDHTNHMVEGGEMMANRLDTNPAKMLGRRELAQHIQAAVEELPPYHKAVIIMREVEGMSYAEMAKAMNVSKGTIMSRLHHARQKLQRALSEYIEGDLVIR
jgi:RNA polymerase sigma-70 factor, ECF subfamily